MIEAIIFDMDGVLVDSEPFHVELEKSQFKHYQISVSEEEHLEYMGVASEVMWRKIAERHQISIPVDELIEQNRIESIRFFSELNEIPVMPGLVELLEKLTQKNYPLAIASSSIPEIIELVLQKTRLGKYFKVVVSTQEAGKSKPEPDVFLLAAKKLGVLPSNCVIIEDSENGIRAAHAAKMSCVAYQGPGAILEGQKDADAIVRNYKQLAMML